MLRERRWQWLPVCLLLVAAAAARADDGSTGPMDSDLLGRSHARHRHSLLQRLLTWPDEDQKKDGDQGDDQPQVEPLESDRPDFTETSSTVGARRLQLESGYTFTQAIGGDRSHNSHDLPEMLLRFGLAERLELRLAWDEGMVFDRQTDPVSRRSSTSAGSSDLDFGLKYALTKQHGWRPQSAIILAGTAPIGSPWQSSGQVDLNVNDLYSWELNKRLSLNCSTGSLWTAESGDHYWRFSQSASLEYELTEKLHLYNEWYGFIYRQANDNRPQHYYNGGLTYLVTPNFQLDWRAGVGLNNVSDGFFTGVGFSYRR